MIESASQNHNQRRESREHAPEHPPQFSGSFSDGQHPKIDLALSYEGGDAGLLEAVLPVIDVLEIVPDSVPKRPGSQTQPSNDFLDQLREASELVELVIHGVGLSIGSYDGWFEPYLEMVDALVNAVPIRHHSEHLGFTRVDGKFMGTMIPMPHTREALDLICERTGRIQDRYKVPFLLENVAALLPTYPGDLSKAGFLNEIAARTGCGILLDVYNLECDRQNTGLDIDAFFDELNFENVKEIHLARGVERDGFLLDVHSRELEDETIDLTKRALASISGDVVVTYEVLRQAVPALGYETIKGEVNRLREAVTSLQGAAV